MHIDGNVTSYEDVTAVQKKVNVEIPWKEVERELAKAYRDLQKHVSVRGFRAGKVPRPMLEKHYGEAVKADVAKELAGHFLEHYLEDKEIIPVAAPVIEKYEYEEGKSLTFSAKLEVKPELDLENYRGIEVTAQPVTVSEEEVQAELETIRERQAQLHPAEGRETPLKGDVVFFELAELKDGAEEKKQNLTAELGSERVNPVLEARFLNSKIGEPFEVDLPAGPDAKEGETKRFKVKVNEIKIKVLPELNDDMAKDLGEFADLAALKNFITERIRSSREERSKADSEEELVKEIIGRNPFPVPESLVQRQLAMYMENLKNALGGQNVDAEAARSELTPRAQFAVQKALVLDAVSKREGITCEDDDVELELKHIADRNKKNVMWVRAHYEKEKLMDDLRYNIKERKVLEYLMREAKVVEKKAEAEPENKG
jgi:trigger factor